MCAFVLFFCFVFCVHIFLSQKKHVTLTTLTTLTTYILLRILFCFCRKK